MTSREFCYWLQGYFEINQPASFRGDMSAEQVELVKKHLQLVFVHEIDPSYPEQDKLNKIHNNDLQKSNPLVNNPDKNKIARC